MKRNVKKYIDEYNKLFTGDKDKFYANDIDQLYTMAKDSPGNLAFSCIQNSLLFGFMIGMKYGQEQTGSKS